MALLNFCQPIWHPHVSLLLILLVLIVPPSSSSSLFFPFPPSLCHLPSSSLIVSFLPIWLCSIVNSPPPLCFPPPCLPWCFSLILIIISPPLPPPPSCCFSPHSPPSLCHPSPPSLSLFHFPLLLIIFVIISCPTSLWAPPQWLSPHIVVCSVASLGSVGLAHHCSLWWCHAGTGLHCHLLPNHSGVVSPDLSWGCWAYIGPLDSRHLQWVPSLNLSICWVCQGCWSMVLHAVVVFEILGWEWQWSSPLHHTWLGGSYVGWSEWEWPWQMLWLVFAGIERRAGQLDGMNKRMHWLGLPYPGSPLVYLPPYSCIKRTWAAHIPLERGGADAAGWHFWVTSGIWT